VSNASPFGSNITVEEAEAVGLTPDVAVAVATPTVRDAPVRRKKAEAPTDNKRIRIILEENDEIPPTGQFFGVQGVGFLLRPGIPADVPLGIIDVLNNAVKSVPIVDPTTQQVTGFKDRLRFPYRVIVQTAAEAA
jgi:hypothetical protein